MAAEPERTAVEALAALGSTLRRLHAHMRAIDVAPADRVDLDERIAELMADADRLTAALRSAFVRDHQSATGVLEITDAERDAIIANIQELFAQVPHEVSLVDELLAQRRRETELEQQ